MQGEKLGKFLQEVSNWKWDEFARAERDDTYSTNQSIIFGLIRACAMQKLNAIQLSLNRIDGKLATPLKIELPKAFYLYPNAEVAEGIAAPARFTEDFDIEHNQELIEAPEPTAEDLPSMGLRETLSKMSDYPRGLPEAIIANAQAAERWIRKQGPRPADDEIPLVKSVVAAHLLLMAQNRNMEAITEVFDQIDGKLTETLKVIGEDMYITRFDRVAPEGAYLNKDGVLQIEAKEVELLWHTKLKEDLMRRGLMK